MTRDELASLSQDEYLRLVYPSMMKAFDPKVEDEEIVLPDEEWEDICNQ